MDSPDKSDIDFSTYQSPFTWRYGSPKMRQIWSVKEERLAWRKIWVALAQAQMSAVLVTAEEVVDLEAQMSNIDIPRALE